ncbi:hypothetical protein [Nereida sp. MMG025]|uniref:hypothetical protein n=1 Tax=Nereida sp. MMG025 TaxID=2909981 RepID=UPI001F37AF23|nr:hypothetical protein [Nereida sp. MMG025]MCF6445819.1 hypothetical protein [Nereida sp. MMG025]
MTTLTFVLLLTAVQWSNWRVTGQEARWQKALNGASDPYDLLRVNPDGLIAPPGIVMSRGLKAHFASDIFDGFKLDARTPRTTEISFASTPTDCRPTPPSNRARVIHIRVARSDLQSGVHAMSQEHMQRVVSPLFQVPPEDRASYLHEIARRPGLQRIDVALTETGLPVYLVLETLDQGAVWALHPAAGVDIERIVLIGHGTSGVTPLGATPIEGLDLDHQAHCADLMVRADITQRLAYKASHVLAGPPARVPYVPMNDRPVTITPNDVVFAPIDPAQGVEYAKSLYSELLNY